MITHKTYFRTHYVPWTLRYEAALRHTSSVQIGKMGIHVDRTWRNCNRTRLAGTLDNQLMQLLLECLLSCSLGLQMS